MNPKWHRHVLPFLIAICLLLPATLLAAAAPPTTEATAPVDFCDDVTEIPSTECEALVALYNSTSGAHWRDNSDAIPPQLGNFLNQEESGFSGPPQPQDATGDVSFGTSISPDGKVTTIVFNDLIAALDSSTDHLVSTRVASFVLPIQSNTDLRVRLDVWGFVDRDPGTRVSLLIHHPGETRLGRVLAVPAAEFQHRLLTTLPAGRDYTVTLVLLTERDSTGPQMDVTAGIDEIEVVLEPYGHAVNPVYEFSGEPRLQNAMNEVSFDHEFHLPNDQGVTISFPDLVSNSGCTPEDMVASSAVSFVIPTEGHMDRDVDLFVRGFVNGATPGTLLIHHAGEDFLVDLPAVIDENGYFDLDFDATLPAGLDYRVTLFSLAECDLSDPGQPRQTALHVDDLAVELGAPAGRHSLSGRVFVDYRCDRYFQSGLDRPLAGVPVTLAFSDGIRVTHTTSDAGLLLFSGFDVTDPVTVTVELPEEFDGRTLASCPSSGTTVTLTAEDFGPFRSKFLTFGADATDEEAGP